MMPPRPPVPSLVAVIPTLALALWVLRHLVTWGWWTGWRLAARRRRRAMLETGAAYVRQLPEGHARDAAQRALEESKRWPEPWECLAWASTQEIEDELCRRERGS